MYEQNYAKIISMRDSTPSPCDKPTFLVVGSAKLGLQRNFENPGFGFSTNVPIQKNTCLRRGPLSK